MSKGYLVSFDTVTPESAEHGEFDAYGWYDGGFYSDPDDRPEPTWLDEPEDEDDPTYVDQRISVLRDFGASEPSSTLFHHGVWYSTEGSWDSDGSSTRYAVHLKGRWTEDEERDIFKAMTRRYSPNATRRRR